MLSTILEDPFATPTVIESGIATLEAVILNAWSRISEESYRMTILRTLVVCWSHLDGGEQVKDVKDNLMKVTGLFVKVSKLAFFFLDTRW